MKAFCTFISKQNKKKRAPNLKSEYIFLTKHVIILKPAAAGLLCCFEKMVFETLNREIKIQTLQIPFQNGQVFSPGRIKKKKILSESCVLINETWNILQMTKWPCWNHTGPHEVLLQHTHRSLPQFLPTLARNFTVYLQCHGVLQRSPKAAPSLCLGPR